MTRFEPPHRSEDASFRRERVFAHPRNAPQPGGASVLLGLSLALAVFLFVGALSFAQATGESTARNVLASSVASTTEIDALLEARLPALRDSVDATSDEPVELPGFPIAAIVTSKQAASAPVEEIRATLLEQATLAVYNDGLAAYDRTGDQDVDSLSAEGMLNRVIGTLTRSNHDLARFATFVLTPLVAAVAVITALSRRGPGRFTLVGGTVALGAMMGLLFSATVYLGVQVLADGDDVFVQELRELVTSLLGVPLRNY
ncbi:MAG TPA: hypothetical protein VFK32_02290, partial [Tepidiformaceae bacterium]|nr:hypothetical protein [Tepidiformaceae bacterium]